MARDISFPEPQELASESLQEILPEEAMGIYQSSFITVGISLASDSTLLAGSLVGVEFTDVSTKVDLKAPTDEVFSFVAKVISGSTKIKSLALNYGDALTRSAEHADIASIKIVDIDARSKMCVLALDLIRV